MKCHGRIIPDMRILLIAIMLVLLPLRGWVGNAMAVTMAAPGPMQTVATEAVLDCHGMDEAEAQDTHGDPMMQAHAAHDMQGAASNTADAHAVEHGNAGHGGGASCSTCSFCQMCHTVALAAPVSAVPGAQSHGALPLASLPADLSATPLPGFKPPIS